MSGIRVEDYVARFGGLTALNVASVEISAGELTALIGPNGAGKTTLLNAMSGLVRAQTSGKIEIDGADVSKWSAPRIAHLGVARSFQDPPLIEDATVLGIANA
jgi:ABC-type branched-subunit amino acid transport system ATPase component